MSVPFKTDRGVVFRCPICDARLSARLTSSREFHPCPDYGYILWCFKRIADGVTVLDVVPERTPEDADGVRMGGALVGSGGAARVVVDLSRLNSISSPLLAKLITLDRQMEANLSCAVCGGSSGRPSRPPS